MKVSEVEKELKGFGCNEEKVTKLLVKCGILEEEKNTNLAEEIVDYIKKERGYDTIEPCIIRSEIYEKNREYVEINLPNCNTAWTKEAFKVAEKVVDNFPETWIHHLNGKKHLYIHVRTLDNQ